MKKLLIISIVILSLFLIYLSTIDQKVYYVSLGDDLALGKTPYGNKDYGYTDYIKDHLKEKGVLEKYVFEFSKEDIRIVDLIKDIEENRKVKIGNKDKTLKNALIKADLVTLSIGFNEIYYKLTLENFNTKKTTNYINKELKNIDKLYSLIKEYCKEDVIVIGIYNLYQHLNDKSINDVFNRTNKELSSLASKYGFTYIDLTDIVNDKQNFIKEINYYPTKEGYKFIADRVIKKVDNFLLNK